MTVLLPAAAPRRTGPRRSAPPRSRERYGIEPEQVPDFIALRGDPSDGLPGAKGIGEKTAARPAASPTGRWRACSRRAAQAGHADAAAGRSLLDGADDMRAFREIATLQPIDDSSGRRTAPTDFARAAEAARRRHGMNRLAERLEGDGYGREPDGDHVAVGHHVVAALEPQRPALARAGVAAGVDERLPADDLGADEALLDVRVDLARGVPRGQAAAQVPATARACPRRR